jgi:hypothetical protein
VFRTDGQSDQHRAFATMWRVPDNLLHFLFLNINARFGSDYFVLISQHNLGEKLLYSHFPPLPPPICQGGRNGYIAIFPGGGGIYYIAIFPPIQVRGKYGYIAIFPGENGYGGKWLYTTGSVSHYFPVGSKQLCFSRTGFVYVKN